MYKCLMLIGVMAKETPSQIMRPSVLYPAFLGLSLLEVYRYANADRGLQ